MKDKLNSKQRERRFHFECDFLLNDLSNTGIEQVSTKSMLIHNSIKYLKLLYLINSI